MPDSYGMDFSADGFRGPNIDPRPIAISAIIVAKAIISAIATYSSIPPPQARALRTISFVQSCTTFGRV
jgi:hypothetical protein